MAHFLINPHHLAGATRHSLDGLLRAWQGEQAFRHEVLVLIALAFILFLTEKNLAEWMLVLGGWMAVMVVELLNTAIEEAFNLISTEWNAHIKAGKDLASAAIFLTMVINFGIWVFVFFLAKQASA